MAKKTNHKGKSAEYSELKGGKTLEAERGSIKTPFRDRVVSGRSIGKK